MQDHGADWGHLDLWYWQSLIRSWTPDRAPGATCALYGALKPACVGRAEEQQPVVVTHVLQCHLQ